MNLSEEIKSAEEIATLKKERQAQYNREFKKKNPDYNKERKLKERSENFEKYLFNQTKSFAKKRGIVFEIELNDVVIPAICPLIGKPITKDVGSGKLWTNPVIFIKDESKGYIKGNVLITCILANHYRSFGSVEELKMFANNFLKMFG